ncbi:MAG: hypothetical protein Q9191_000139 [Dirinaria sp. TL-2023a]
MIQAQRHFEMSREKFQRRLKLQTDRKDIISYVLLNNQTSEITLPELEATSALLIVAGAESTASSLTATTNLLLRNRPKLEKLCEEIHASFDNESDITLSALEKLPYLQAVFQEGFRMAPAIPTQIPRIVPPGGDTVCGEFLPGNTFVGVPQFAAYRSKDNFSFPDDFIPERWLPGPYDVVSSCVSDPGQVTSTLARDNRKVVQPFSVGPRSCIAITLAYAEMRLVLAKLLWNFRLSVPDGYSMIFEEQKTYALWQRESLMIGLESSHKKTS